MAQAVKFYLANAKSSVQIPVPQKQKKKTQQNLSVETGILYILFV
jgi:hypothetical protein